MYRATVYTHRRDYMGVLANPPTREFPETGEGLALAKAWVYDRMAARRCCYGEIESDGYLAVTGTDDDDWERLA